MPPKITLKMSRFIATNMIFVRIAPLQPKTEPTCRNDLMVYVCFLEPNNEKVHQQCSQRVCAKTRSGLSDRITNKKKLRRGTQDSSTTKALYTRFKASHAIFPFAECGPRFFHTWNCREERGLTVSFASTLSPCPVWSAMGWALPNRLAHTAGSFLIRSCREFSHLSLLKNH